ncbi:MAG: TlpA disulfide reductase family protein, partial [Candidatus Neomarinimicrobiota bacterium]
STTCIPCRQEIPFLDSLQAEFPQVSFFLVDVNEEPQIVKDYIRKMQYKIPVLIDRYGQVAKKYEANITPTLVCIDTDGRVVFYKRGFKASEKPHIRAQVKKLLPNKSAAGE